jgi:prepilin-type N-terminal cleavage/methylation domain-containing protein
MNLARSNRKAGAFTLIEMLCVVAIIAILAALLLPTLNRGQGRARRIQCVDNLKELGVGFHVFMHDHNSRFPMQVPMKDGGSQEFVQNGFRVNGEFYFSFRHFLALSNEIVTPKILACPADTRRPAANFASFNNETLSYFVGVQADYSIPDSILAGDRNITNDLSRPGSILRLTSSNPVRWTEELHRFKGNLLSADGHVWEAGETQLTSAFGSTAANSALFLPTAKSVAAVASSGGGASSSGGATSGNGVRPANARPAPAPTASGKALPMVQTLIVSARENQPAATPSDTAATNVVVKNAPPMATAVGSGGSGFTDWMDDLAGKLSLPVWLLYLLLLLMLVGVGTMALRQRSH